MTTYRPSLVVDFTLMFDEALHVVPDQPLFSPQYPAQSTAPGSRAGLEPLVFRRGARSASFVMGRVPQSGSFELPGYRQAGTFTFQFAFRELPIDPRTVRACAVDIHLGAVSDSDFARDIATGAAVLRTRDNAGKALHRRMRGVVDEWDVAHGTAGSTITVSGRDLRGLLLDTNIGGGDPKDGAGEYVLRHLDRSRPINSVIEELLSYNPQFADISVRVDPSEWEGGLVRAPGKESAVPRHRKGAKGGRTSGRASPPGGTGAGSASRTSFWDLIVRECYLCGAIPYFDGADLLVRPARGIYAQQQAGEGLVRAPFAGGRPRAKDAASGGPVVGGPLRLRRMVYGRDIEEVSFNRKLGGYQRPHTVRAVAVDASHSGRGGDRVLEARWPPEDETKARRQRQSPGGKQSSEEILNVPVPGVRDLEQLRAVARGIYEEIGRGEVGGSCSTKNLASFGGDNDDPDLLRLAPGDAVEFLVDQRSLRTTPPLVSAFTDSQRRSFSEQVAEVAEYLGDEDLARVVVATARGQVAELQRTFRVGAVRYNWGNDGLKTSFDYQNYIEVRADV